MGFILDEGRDERQAYEGVIGLTETMLFGRSTIPMFMEGNALGVEACE